MEPEDSPEFLKEQRKKASQIGLLLGGIAFIVGAIICLIYLLAYKPWRMDSGAGNPVLQKGAEPHEPQ